MAAVAGQMGFFQRWTFCSCSSELRVPLVPAGQRPPVSCVSRRTNIWLWWVGQEVGAAVATELRCGLMLWRWHRWFLEAADAFQLDLVGDSGCYGDHDRGPSELNDNSWKTKGRNNFADVRNKLLLTFTSKRVQKSSLCGPHSVSSAPFDPCDQTPPVFLP